MVHRSPDDPPFPYQIEYISGIRRIEIYLRNGRDVVVRAPPGTLAEKIRTCVREHAAAVTRKLKPSDSPTGLFRARGRLIPFSVEFRPRCRTVTLDIREGGHIVVKAPPGTTRHEIDAAFRTHEAWLLRALETPRGEEHASLRAGGTMIPYVIAYNQRAVNLTLKILPDNTVRVTAPAAASKETVRSFVASHATYIHETIAAPGRTPARPIEYTNGGALLVFGKEVTIRTVPANGRDEGSLTGNLLLVPDDRPVRETVSAFLQKTTRAEVNRSLPRYADALGVAVPPIRIRFLKTVWGNCIPDVRIVFNERLAILPPDLIEYVVAHELCHIRHPHHQKTFYDTLRTVMQDADARKVRLKSYHPLWAKGDAV
ncbi:MAG: SprT family zinc-dependent metalloprotease [Methanofollis sp.]|uniref:M48 family metallopeptidase n=1 Tax=Methanofollis sp. TaxID=2052835 RepID=UPI002629CB3B|nr:SprT family zinc-dependent metalloprotease [Methanofollis sp.]MDD4255663.1 SprT family zinc-dependent metalloprotease [Methanofollis sp.]